MHYVGRYSYESMLLCMSKYRMSASVDADLVEAGHAAVAAGEAHSLSAWVNEALRRQAEHDRRLRALDEFLAAFEAEHGPISATEMSDARSRARGRAVVVRGERVLGSVSSTGGS